MHLPHNSSVLVADGRKYLIFRNHGDAHRLDLRLQTQGEQPNLKNHELHSDAPGTQTQRWGHARPAMEATDFHQQNEDRLAQDIAEQVNAHAHAGDITSLVVIAPPKTMAVLRAHWHKTVAEKIICEISKDMIDRPTPDIEALLAGHAHPPG